MAKTHHYISTTIWTGNTGNGTKDYQSYERSHVLKIDGKPDVLCSSDAPFRGDVSKHNPEDMFVASFVSCHMLWYLHLCADAGIAVVSYEDKAEGILEQDSTGSGKFTEINLHPIVEISDPNQEKLAMKLHEKAHHFCFMANSVNFPVKHHPSILIKS